MSQHDDIEKTPPAAVYDEHRADQVDDIHVAALADDPEVARMPSLATIASIFFLGLSTVAPIACGFIVATSILVNIGTDLGNTSDLGWIVSGWSIASSVSFALAGSLSDIFGRRNVILFGQLIALIGAIVASTAHHMSVLIAGSTLLGLSCGLILVAYAAIPELLPNKYRGIGLAWTEGALHIPWGGLAVLLGNLFVLHATWRWVYYISTIYAAICLAGTAVFYFPPARPLHDFEKTRLQQVRELDYIGILLYTGGLASVLLGLSWGGEAAHPWRSASVVAPIVVGALGFIGCFLYDFFVRDSTNLHTLFPRDLMTRFREYTVSLVVVFVAGMVYYSMSALLPQGTFYVFTNEPLQIGITALPNGLGQMTGACIVPLFLHKTKRPKWYIIIALFVQTLFTALCAYGISNHKAAWMAFQFFSQGCFALITVTTVFNAGLHVRPSELGVAVGLLGTFRSMGGSVGNAIFSTILRTEAAKEIPKQIIGAATTNGYTGDLSKLISAVTMAGVGVLEPLTSLHLSPTTEAATLAAFHSAYAASFRIVFYSTIPFGIVALVAAVFIKDASKYMTNHTQVRLEKDILKRSVEPKTALETPGSRHEK